MKNDLKKIIEEEAGHWLVRLGSGNVSSEDKAAFQRWYEKSSSHQAAWAYVSAVDVLADELVQEAPVVEGESEQRHVAPKARPLLKVFSLAAVLFASILGYQGFLYFDGIPQSYETDTGELRRYALPDGSSLYLSASSRVTLDYSEKERNLSLEKGQAYFTVSADPDRPFTVHVAGAEVKALGTAFDVHRYPHGVSVSVLDGVVSVARDKMAKQAIPAVQAVVIKKGQKASLSEKKAEAVITNASPERFSTWQRGVLDYNMVPLETVLADVGRYTKGKIVLEDERLASLPVTAVLAPGDFEKVALLLEQVLPVRSMNKDVNTILLVSTHSGNGKTE